MSKGRVNSSRLTQLDGLRGIAILLVIFNHFRLEPLYQIVPNQLHIFLEMLTGNGKMAVGVLFMLSGFLMASLYAKVNRPLVFWQKRYTRIFPAFISMSFALTIIRFFWGKIPAIFVPLIIICVITINAYLWKRLRENSRRKQIGKTLFIAFLFLQLIVAFSYILLQQIVPAAVYYQIWPQSIRSLIDFLVNSTLTLPFGKFVGQLDGVYWSIITEVLLYLLYPILFLPIFHVVSKQKKSWFSFLVWVASFPFFYCLWQLSQEILGMSILQIQMGEFFITGMIIANLVKTPFFHAFSQKIKKIPSLLLIFITLGLIIGAPLFRRFCVLSFPIESLFWVLPIALVLLICLSDNAWSRFLQQRFLVFLGTMSYALYLNHTIAIELFVRHGAPTTFSSMLLCLIGSIGLMAFLSWFLHTRLEWPYLYHRLPKTKEDRVLTQTSNHSFSFKTIYWWIISVVLFLLTIWFAYHVPVTATARVFSHPQPQLTQITILSREPLHLEFKAEQANLGMILFALKPLTLTEQTQLGLTQGIDSEDELQVTIRDEQQNILTQAHFPLYAIFESPFHPVGLPIVADSLGKIFSVDLQMQAQQPLQRLALVSTTTSFRSVYFPGKQALLQKPQLLLTIIAEKIKQPFHEKAAQQAIILALPLFLLILIVSIKTPTKNFNQ